MKKFLWKKLPLGGFALISALEEIIGEEGVQKAMPELIKVTHEERRLFEGVEIVNLVYKLR